MAGMDGDGSAQNASGYERVRTNAASASWLHSWRRQGMTGIHEDGSAQNAIGYAQTCY